MILMTERFGDGRSKMKEHNQALDSIGTSSADPDRVTLAFDKSMNNTAIITIASLFYLTLAIGAIARFKRNRNLMTSLQAMGVLLPILPAALMLKHGVTTTLMIAYGLLWLPMGIGYLIEGLKETGPSTKTG